MIAVPRGSVPIEALYPTQFEWLRRCPLHVAFGQEQRRRGGKRRKSDPQRLGDVVHRVMRRVVADGSLLAPDWRAAVDEAWATEVVAEEAAAAGAQPRPGPSSGWAQYEEKRLRTLRLVERIRSLAIDGEPGGFLPEQVLSGSDGRLKGVADLIVRTSARHGVIDYKTGSVVGEDREGIKGEYDRQLRMYAALERESSGSWPDFLAVYPLKGDPVEIDPDSGACEAVAADALQVLGVYNAAAPGPQEARPSPAWCPRCEYAPHCDAFWAALPMEDIIAVQGLVLDAFFAERGAVSLVVQQDSGPPVEVLGILPAFHPAVALVRTGDMIRITGLESKDEEGYYRLPPRGQLAVWKSGA